MSRPRSNTLCLMAAVAAAGCASTDPATVPVLPDDRLVAARRLADDGPDEPPPKVVEVRVAVPSPQLRPLAPPAPSIALTGPAAVAAATGAATTQPTTEGFLNAIQYYDYAPGVVYTAVTCPGYVTTIALRPGERLLTAAAGDTVRWAVDSVEAGSGATAQTLLLVKPRRPGVRTNLLVTTDQRVYALDLTSNDGGVYHTMIAWNYPYGDLVAVRAAAAEGRDRAGQTVAGGIDLSKANFDYLILRQRGVPLPPWCPLRAFDDGRRTYVQFPPRVAVTEAPPLFVLGRAGDAQLVNYRVRGDWYVVDRLFDRAELRLGQAPQTVIGIARADVRP